jgi:hypothetical protein
MMTTKITFERVEHDEAGRAWAVMKDGAMTDLQVTSYRGTYRVREYSCGTWTTLTAHDTLDKAKTAAKRKA